MASPAPERDYTIYALVDPRGQRTRYIGKTRDVWRRVSTHLLLERGSAAKLRWLQDLKAQDLLPIVTVLEKKVPAEESDAQEWWWIQEYRRRGEDLTNVQAPGRSPFGRSVRWKLSLPEAMLDAVRTEAKRRQMDPSKLVQEWIWTGLSQP